MKRRVLVTGASGFIGKYVVEQLTSSDFEVHASARRCPDNLPSDVIFHQADLLADGVPEQLINAVQPTYLMHLAWNAQPGLFWNAADNLDWVAASLRLYRAFANAGGQRAVFAGSCAEYDWTNQSLLSEDSTPLAPGTLYGTCKDSLRRILETVSRQNKLSFAWGRIFWIYGPGEQSGRLVSDLTNGLLRGQSVPCSDGQQRRDFMHVKDVARAFVHILESDKNGAINIGSGTAVKIAEIIALTAELIGRHDLVQMGRLPAPQNQPEQLVANISRLQNELRFSPQYELRTGLEETIQWWKNAMTTH